eukprot:9578381-Lingulodinium_polyedra.AAC.1
MMVRCALHQTAAILWHSMVLHIHRPGHSTWVDPLYMWNHRLSQLKPRMAQSTMNPRVTRSRS